MKKVILSATQARKQFFDLLNSAQHEGQITEIINKKTNEILARILPPENQKIDWKTYRKTLRKAVGVFTEEDLKQVKQAREESRKPRFPDWQ